MYTSKIRRVVAALTLLLSSVAFAQQPMKPLTNADVVTLIKGQMPEDVVVSLIQQSHTNFDTSPQALIELKNQGATPKVLDAMLRASKSPAPTSANDAETIPQGVVLIHDSERRQMNQAAANLRVTTGGINPLGKARGKKAFAGKQSPLRFSDRSPTFEVPLYGDVYPSDHIALVKFSVKSDRREIEIGSFGAFSGSKSGFNKDDVVPITIDEIKPNAAGPAYYKLYRIKVVNPLAPGEYALVHDRSFYDFGVDAIK
jgi:hypothetical protein